MADTEHSDVTALTVELLSAYLSNNTVAPADLAELIRSTRAVLAASDAPEQAEEPAEVHTPAVSVRKSLANPGHILSLIDGKPYQTLKRHLATHGLTPQSYRARYGLPDSYPMVSPSFADRRREIAKTIGLGRRGGAQAAAAPVTEAKIPEAPAPEANVAGAETAARETAVADAPVQKAPAGAAGKAAGKASPSVPGKRKPKAAATPKPKAASRAGASPRALAGTKTPAEVEPTPPAAATPPNDSATTLPADATGPVGKARRARAEKAAKPGKDAAIPRAKGRRRDAAPAATSPAPEATDAPPAKPVRGRPKRAAAPAAIPPGANEAASAADAAVPDSASPAEDAKTKPARKRTVRMARPKADTAATGKIAGKAPKA